MENKKEKTKRSRIWNKDLIEMGKKIEVRSKKFYSMSVFSIENNKGVAEALLDMPDVLMRFGYEDSILLENEQIKYLSSINKEAFGRISRELSRVSLEKLPNLSHQRLVFFIRGAPNTKLNALFESAIADYHGVQDFTPQCLESLDERVIEMLMWQSSEVADLLEVESRLFQYKERMSGLFIEALNKNSLSQEELHYACKEVTNFHEQFRWIR